MTHKIYMRFIEIILSTIFLISILNSAEYNGRNIDGERYDATVYSYSTSHYYNVEVEFDGEDVTIYFSNGGHITVTMDCEEIEDPHDISAYDYKNSVYWDIDVDGLD